MNERGGVPLTIEDLSLFPANPQEFASRFDGYAIEQLTGEGLLPFDALIQSLPFQSGFVINGNVDKETWKKMRGGVIPLRPGGSTPRSFRIQAAILEEKEEYGEVLPVIVKSQKDFCFPFQWHFGLLVVADLDKPLQVLVSEAIASVKNGEGNIASKRILAAFAVAPLSEQSAIPNWEKIFIDPLQVSEV